MSTAEPTSEEAVTKALASRNEMTGGVLVNTRRPNPRTGAH